MSFGVIEHFEWLKAKSSYYHDLASSGVHGPTTLESLRVPTGDLPISGGNPYGYPPLKEWLAGQFGVTVDQVALTQGASGANFAVVASIISDRDQVVLETPVYQPMTSVASAITKLPLMFFERSPSEKYRIDPDRVAEVHDNPKLIVTTNLHNPSGIFEPFDTFVKIADSLGRSGGYLLVDEIFLPFMDDWEWKTAAALHDRIIATGSLTKAWGLSGLRMGWAIGPKDVIYKVQRLLDYTQGIQSIFNEALALRLLEGGVATELLFAARRKTKSNRELLIRWLENWRRVEFIPPDAGAVVYARHPQGMNVDLFCEKLWTKYNVLITPGRFFRDESALRIGVAAEREEIKQWLEYLRETFEEFWN